VHHGRPLKYGQLCRRSIRQASDRTDLGYYLTDEIAIGDIFGGYRSCKRSGFPLQETSSGFRPNQHNRGKKTQKNSESIDRSIPMLTDPKSRSADHACVPNHRDGPSCSSSCSPCRLGFWTHRLPGAHCLRRPYNVDEMDLSNSLQRLATA
jgi:hypothetical protein